MKILDISQFIAERMKFRPVTNAEMDVAKEQIKKALENKAKDPRMWEIGDIAYTSWGYSMTLVDFYRLVRRIGKVTFEFETLDSKIVSGSYTSPAGCYEVPNESKPGGLVRGRIDKNGYLKMQGRYLHLWDGKPVYANHCD